MYPITLAGSKMLKVDMQPYRWEEREAAGVQIPAWK